jgi:Protein of unknown function (DUF4239)
MDFLYSIPAPVFLVMVLVLSITIACGGQVSVHRHFGGGSFIAHNEVGGIIIAVAGGIYAVILGFLTITAWERAQEARQLAVFESNADIDAWHTAVGLPPAVRQRVRADMLQYVNVMIESEWPLMKHGQVDPTAAFIGMDAIDATGTFVPANSAESNAQQATLEQLGIMHDARQRRVLINASGGLSWFEWLVLLLGAICLICFCWLFGLEKRRTHLLMTSTVVAMIAAVMVLLFELQYPFRSSVGIDPEVWQGALAHIHQMQVGNQMDMR